MIIIENLQPYGVIGDTVRCRQFGRGPVVLEYQTKTHGWQWDVVYDDRTVSYRTNREGEGLWVYSDLRDEWKQVRGTCQFSLKSNRRSAMAAIRKRFIG